MKDLVWHHEQKEGKINFRNWELYDSPCPDKRVVVQSREYDIIHIIHILIYQM